MGDPRPRQIHTGVNQETRDGGVPSPVRGVARRTFQAWPVEGGADCRRVTAVEDTIDVRRAFRVAFFGRSAG